uniref:Uncharacterized protein n=1 Tax=Gasterosteus aculeatus aculeatus TaxID=481459 RepID=A0AAQ4PHQ9_GASAC
MFLLFGKQVACKNLFVDLSCVSLRLVTVAGVVLLNMDVCFILDGVLILYGIVLTVLYCRLRVRQTGTTHTHTRTHTRQHDATDVYETIKMDKSPAR